MKNRRVPITIICGFLGSGKTTLLNNMLRQSQDRKIAVIVNEFGEVNVDSKLVKHTTEKMIELSNGCICCTLRGDLIEGVDELIREHDVDHIVIESTGIGEPIPIAQAFYVHPELLALNAEVPKIQHKVYVDSVITMVDSAQFMEMYQRNRLIEEDQLNRGYGQLLAEQIEGADILILNKSDKATRNQIKTLMDLFSTMNPRAHIIEAEQADVNLDKIIDVQLFDIEIAEQSSLWIAELEKEPSSESDEYGIETYVYSTDRRFDESKLMDSLHQGLPEEILRSKGLIALEGSDDAFLWNQAGKFLEFNKIGQFANPTEAKTEIVFIGQDMSRREIAEKLESAFSTEMISKVAF